jgi:hypothetical protein
MGANFLIHSKLKPPPCTVQGKRPSVNLSVNKNILYFGNDQ